MNDCVILLVTKMCYIKKTVRDINVKNDKEHKNGMGMSSAWLFFPSGNESRFFYATPSKLERMKHLTLHYKRLSALIMEYWKWVMIIETHRLFFGLISGTQGDCVIDTLWSRKVDIFKRLFPMEKLSSLKILPRRVIMEIPNASGFSPKNPILIIKRDRRH